MSRFEDLWEGYLTDRLDEVELKELLQMMRRGHEQVRSSIGTLLQEDNFSDPENKAKAELLFDQLMRRSQQPARVIPGRFLKKVGVAAAVLLLASVTAIMLLQKDDPIPDVAKVSPPAAAPATDVIPGSDKATLILSDGTVVFLDSASKGALTNQGGITVINLDGQLAYQGSESQAAEVLYNTVSTPRGGQYQLVLADGTKVWLNAASSLRFPTVFPGEERSVELTGEGYFEVSHDAAKPFHVKVNDMEVQVLGTHFNINSYGDEPAVKTTLLAGRIKVMKHGKHVILNPGQQAVIQPKEDHIRVAYGVDLEEVIAWKDGRFLFNSAGIETIMRQAERWYNVEVIYEGKTDETFSGVVPRSENISQLLKILEATDRVDFEIRGKEVIVKSK